MRFGINDIMSSKTAKSEDRTAPTPRLIVFVIYPGVKLLDVAGPLQVFADAARSGGALPAYRTKLASLDGGSIPSDTSVALPSVPLSSLAEESIDTLLMAGGNGVFAAMQDERLTASLRATTGQVRRVGSICTGAFLLAAAGLLSGKRAVTHWQHCERLADYNEDIQVEADSIFIEDGGIWTSAGVTAGIDLALAMVAEDLGRSRAMELARALVSFMVRPGGQSQFSPVLMRQAADAEGRFDALHDWMAANLDGDLRVEALAEQAGMSPRNFARLYTQRTGQTPAKAVEAMRIEAARDLLETSEMPVSRVALDCGFGDDERLRRAFMRQLKVAPSDYRARFRS